MASAYTIGALAKAAGVPVSTIRYYERIEVLRPESRTESGYRMYGAAELERLRLVKLAQGVGFTLDDVALLLKLREKAPVPKAQVDLLVRARLTKLDEQLAQLNELRCVLVAALDCCVGANCECPKCRDLELLQEELSGDFRKSA
jgi:MerR family mercuric resistance operon transcriptional regulator